MNRLAAVIALVLGLVLGTRAFVAPCVRGVQQWRKNAQLNMAENEKGESDSVRRRRSRRKRDRAGVELNTPEAAATPEPAVKPLGSGQPVITANKEDDGTASLEDMFGLGNEQLRELMEQELPVPREDIVTKKETTQTDADKVFSLPDLSEFIDPQQEKEELRAARSAYGDEEVVRINRNNQEEYARVMQLNPFADADDTMFIEEYDIIPSIFGSGKLLGIPVPYLQTGHGILLIVCVLAGFVYAPGNPLTEFPLEVRDFLKSGLGVVYSINIVLAVQGFLNAKSKNLPAFFWGAKCLILGGIAYYEITQAVDPAKVGEPKDKSYLSDRKSTNKNPEKWKR